MTGTHHPRRSIERRTEVVTVAKFGLAGCDAHPYRQLQPQLRGHSSIHCRARRRERRAHTIAGVLEQPAPVRLDRRAQHLVMGGEGLSHRVRVCFPPTGRTLNIGEQERHNTRRRGPCGHPHRLSHQPPSAQQTATDFRDSRMSSDSRPSRPEHLARRGACLRRADHYRPGSLAYTSRTAFLTNRSAVRSTNTWLPSVHDCAVKCGLGVRGQFRP